MANSGRSTNWWPPRRAAALAIAAGLLALASVGVAIFMRAAGPTLDLATIERDVVRRWPMIDQLGRVDLERLLADQRDVALIDVREPAEYAVSRLPGAIRVAPDIPPDKFLTEHAARLAGRTVVFYCSVGVRSSMLAARVQDHLKNRGVSRIFNLTGGIFGWHNDGRPLVDAGGKTERVHGYDERWGRLVTRRSQVQVETR